MHKYFIIAVFVISIEANAQETLTFQSADSLMYQCYLKGDWGKLIVTGEQAIGQNIDYKRLRQRIGFAFFMKADYFASQKQYEKALAFDEYDTVTREYLYYCSLYTGNEVYSRYHAGKLPVILQKSLNCKEFSALDAIDLEFNYKANTSSNRSNPTYIRLGLSSQLGYRFSVYQSVSNYTQTLDSSLIKQPDYYALLNWSITAHIALNVAYHYLNTNIEGVKYHGNLVFSSFSAKIDRFSLGLNGSVLSNNLGNFTQFGLQAGVALPGKINLYFNSSLSEMIDSGNARSIFSQFAGARITRTLWAEGSVTLGNLQDYTDYNALYIYNTIDPTTFRTGLSLFWHPGKRLTLTGNYTFETKRIENPINTYKQYSFLGGIRWKI